MKPKFAITDYWHRYEFQGRGSTHVHGFAWIDPNAVPELSVPLNQDAHREAFTQFWSKHIFAINPEPDRQPPPRRSRGTYNTRTDELANSFSIVSDVVNRTQVHKCSDGYCQRKRKRDDGTVAAGTPRTCRFYFPRTIGPATTNKVCIRSQRC
jgi:ATP-dependent DNA helicase PIF1